MIAPPSTSFASSFYDVTMRARFRRKGAAGDVVAIDVADDSLADLVSAFAEALRTQR